MKLILAHSLLYIILTNSFYVSLNQFTFSQADAYCISHCQSNLVSIHNELEYDELLIATKLALNNALISIDSTTQLHIGLRAINPNDFKWTDGTLFNFGNNTSRGVYPWNYNHPHNTSSTCTVIQMSAYYDLWTTHLCAETYAIFACNHCHETLTKYSIITDTNTRAAHASLCSSSFGTELSAMHSPIDFEEASMICAVAGILNCYVGLYWNTDSYLWDDGTTFDYASQLSTYPWDNIPNPSIYNCTNIDKSNVYKTYLSDTLCTTKQYAICNLPSEICYEDIWSTMTGFGWTFATQPCSILNDNRYTERGLAIITTKQWDNHGDNLVFEYIFAINQVTANVESTAGVVWYINGTCSPSYYIGISIPDNEVFIAYVTGETITNIDSNPLPTTYELGTFIVLRGEIRPSNKFTISVNEHTLLQDIEGTDLFTFMDTSIGYIGIMNTKSLIIARSLFISGDMKLDVPQNAALWFVDCVASSSEITTTSKADNDDEAQVLLSTSAIIAIAAVLLCLCLFCCCVVLTCYKVSNAKKEKHHDSNHVHHDPEEIVNIQMQNHVANMSPVQKPAVVRVSANAHAPHMRVMRPQAAKPLDNAQNMATEYERAFVAAWFENDVGLPQYYKLFIQNGYESMRIIKEIEDRAQLIEIGITLIGHQTMILSEIQRFNIQSHISITDQGMQQKDGYQDTNVTGIQNYFKHTMTGDTDTYSPDKYALPPGALNPGEGFDSGKLGSLPDSFCADDLFGTYKQ